MSDSAVRSTAFTERVVRFFERWFPDAFVLAVLLTFLTFGLVILRTESSVGDAVGFWGDGLWGMLSFTNQIILTLMFGYVLANTPPARKVLLWLCGFVRTPTQAYLMICFVSGLLALGSWSLSMIGAALMALAIGEVARQRQIPLHFPLLVASGFVGLVVWHQGFASSVGLSIATPDHILEDRLGVIPTSETIFSPVSMGIVVTILLTLPWIMSRLHPKDSSVIKPMPAGLMSGASTESQLASRSVSDSPAERLEHSRLLCWAVVVLGAGFLWIHYTERGGGLTLNTMNLLFLLLGLAGAGTLAVYLKLLDQSGRIAAPFLLQYPFYAGIAGLINTSGLGEQLAQGFASLATADSLPLVTFFSAGLLNLFIPSGGAQWAVQGPVMIDAAVQLGADLRAVSMAVILGDQWSNLIHPLTLIPMLAVTRLNIRDVIGYCFFGFLWCGLIFALAAAFLLG